MEQLPEELLYLVFEYLPLDVKIQTGRIEFLRRYEARNIRFRILSNSTHLYRLDGQIHRSDGPAIVEHYIDDMVKTEAWYRNNLKHRDGDPAIITYDIDGNIRILSWWQNDELLQEIFY